MVNPLLQKEQDQVKMIKKGNQYQLQLELTQPEKIKPFAKYVEENPQTNGKHLNSTVTYHSFQLSLTINEKTFLLKEMQFDLHYTFPAFMPKEVEIKEHWKFIWQGPGTPIKIPQEAQKTKAVQ